MKNYCRISPKLLTSLKRATFNFTAEVAASSSKRGIETDLTGASRDLPITNLMCMLLDLQIFFDMLPLHIHNSDQPLAHLDKLNSKYTMGLSPPNSSRHSSCKINLAFSMTGVVNLSGSKTALTWKRTPLLLSSLSFTFTSV